MELGVTYTLTASQLSETPRILSRLSMRTRFVVRSTEVLLERTREWVTRRLSQPSREPWTTPFNGVGHVRVASLPGSFLS